VPGPGAHWQCYRYLKDRQIEALVRQQCPPKQKGQVRAPIMLITGVRRDESTRRMGTTKPIKYRQNMAQLWVAPFIDWTRADLDEYRLSHDVPHNEVADVMHMSMECACGAFGSRDEFNMIATFYPELATQIVRAENLALDAGQQHHEWGRPRKEVRVSARQLEFTDLCAKCTM
jgi:3'-phosphoadenosine 5'-phosphosulfate sulfotransferase (PAPS reductase)/FAD synthetase